MIKRSLEKTTFILKTATQQQHNYARTLQKSVRKVKWKRSEKLNKNNLLYEALLQSNLQFQSVVYCWSLNPKSNHLNDYFVSYMWVTSKSAAVLGSMTSAQNKMNAWPWKPEKTTDSNSYLLCKIASLNQNFIYEYIICYCLHLVTVTNHFNITLSSISFPVFSSRLISHSWPTHQQSSMHGQCQTVILSPSQQLHNSSKRHFTMEQLQKGADQDCFHA